MIDKKLSYKTTALALCSVAVAGRGDFTSEDEAWLEDELGQQSGQLSLAAHEYLVDLSDPDCLANGTPVRL